MGQLKNQIFFGTDKFIEDMQHKISSETSLNEIPSCTKSQAFKALGFL